ncbi:hypothetical protein ACFJIS_19000 [Variovorax boronicumulans]|uniref:hypothetical protein n=1 Tax=Variovorax boronicumulans TaxID=436515 RepID=UPI0036F37F4B
MIDHAHDLAAVFYGPDFAAPFLRQRPAADAVTVMAILGTVDDEVLESRAVAAIRTARFVAGQDVRADDKLIAMTAFGPDVPVGTAFRVLEKPRRVNDGLELEALLGSATA